MGVKTLISAIFVLLVIFILFIYWFVPINITEFNSKTNQANFSLIGLNKSDMQFYPNMRFPYTQISYKIEDSCTLQKKDEMTRAFNIVENKSLLDFRKVNSLEEITVSCENKNRVEQNMFVAGEGGPTNVTINDMFNIIYHGDVLLIRDSKCPQPNIALHELFHVLGFNHSTNPNNIMYPVSDCDQVISSDMIGLLNEVYAIPSYSDLIITDASAVMHGKYLDIEVKIRNNGVISSEDSNLIISSGEDIIRDIDIEPLYPGYGISLSLTNTWVPKLVVDELKFYISSEFNELDKKNNEIKLEIKK